VIWQSDCSYFDVSGSGEFGASIFDESKLGASPGSLSGAGGGRIVDDGVVPLWSLGPCFVDPDLRFGGVCVGFVTGATSVADRAFTCTCGWSLLLSVTEIVAKVENERGLFGSRWPGSLPLASAMLSGA
jgi:hypothetical protein